MAAEWLGKLKILCDYVAAGEQDDREPICFVLGAGDSLTSNAPTTKALAKRFNRITDERFGTEPESRAQALEQVNEDEKRRAIKELFQGVRPYIGYRCLAAMGFTRRIIVFTLNWDVALDTACREAGVLIDSISLDEGPERLAETLEGDGAGVLVIHAHGQWDGDWPLKWGTIETLAFDRKTEILLAERVFRHTTVVIGASLSGDLDLRRLIEGISAQRLPPLHTRPLHIVSREPLAALDAAPVAEWLSSRRSVFNPIVDPAADFDTAMVAIRAAQAGLPFSELRRKANHLDLPDWEDIVWPRPELLRPHLGAKTIAFVGETKLGKSTISHLLAWFAALWQPEPICPVSMHGPSATMKALTATGSAASSSAPLVLDDPFGAEHLDSNPDFVSMLENLPPDAPAVLVCSRLANWREAGDELPSGLVQPPCGPSNWYSEGALLDLLASCGDEAGETWRELVVERELNTPARVLAAVEGDFAPDPDDPGNVADKTRLLCRDLQNDTQRPGAVMVLLARLQELNEEPRSRRELELAAGQIDEDSPSWRALRSMLHDFELDGVDRVKLSHSTDRTAVDVVLRGRTEDIAELLKSLGPTAGWSLRALEVFIALDALREGKFERLWALPAELRATWGPLLIRPALADSPEAAWETIEGLYDDPAQDFWSCCELVYDVLRLWRDLTPNGTTKKRAAKFLTRLLDNRHLMGAYVLLEASLYHRGAIEDAVWWPLKTKILELCREPGHDFELGLVFDGLVWRPPADEKDLKHLFEALIEASEHSEGLAGAYALACAYHSAGAAIMLDRYPRLGEMWKRDLSEPEAAQAARLIRFHFAHQSRARTMLARRPFEGGSISYLSRTLYEGELGDRGDLIVDLIEKIAAHADHAGWAFYLSLNLSTTQGEFQNAQKARIVKCLPPAADEALIAAAITHERPPKLREQLLRRLTAPGAGEMLLDLLRDGFDIDGWRVMPPRFHFVRDMTDVYATFELDWSELKKEAGVDATDHPEFVLRYESAAELAVEYGAPEWAVKVLLDRIRRGDPRDLLVKAPPRESDDDPYLWSLLFAAKEMEEPPELF